MKEMQQRFQSSRWSPQRRELEAMQPGQDRSYPLPQLANIRAVCQRLSDAYYGERFWKVNKMGDNVLVRCMKPEVQP